MPDVLIVDDEKNFLHSLQDGLREHSEDFHTLWATDGGEALRILESRPVDLLVTDLKLPVVNGFELLAHLTRRRPELPVIVMTAFGTPEIEMRLSRLDHLHYLEKPVDLDLLIRSIYAALRTGSKSHIRGITLSTFLQLIHMEKKTCSLKIRSRGRIGYLYVRGGKLQGAETPGLEGERAALEIVAWEDVEIEMDGICRRDEGGMDASLEFILLEAMRIKDERTERGESSPPPPGLPASSRYEGLFQEILNIQGIAGMAVFDDHGFLEFKNVTKGPLLRVDPAVSFEEASHLGEITGLGPLKSVLYALPGGKKMLVLKRFRYCFVLLLASRAVNTEVMGQIERKFQERQNPGRRAP